MGENDDLQEHLVAEELVAEGNMSKAHVLDNKEKIIGECVDCKEIIAAATTQSEMKGFLQSQEIGLDASYRCIRCRNCKECLKGAGQERMSIRQEAEQQVIKESVHIDKDLGRAVAKLPFMVDPADKLVDNLY